MTTADLPTGDTAPILDADELRAWLRLAHAKGLRPLALRMLFGAFGGPREVLSESFASLAETADARAAGGYRRRSVR